jgi:hypothetical protein
VMQEIWYRDLLVRRLEPASGTTGSTWLATLVFGNITATLGSAQAWLMRSANALRGLVACHLADDGATRLFVVDETGPCSGCCSERVSERPPALMIGSQNLEDGTWAMPRPLDRNLECIKRRCDGTVTTQ